MLEPRTTVLATCEPYPPGYGFRAELHHVALPSGRDVYRLVSWDASGDFGGEPTALEGPTLRAECDVSDYRSGAGGDKSDAHLASVLCGFWSAYASRPEEFEREPGYKARAAQCDVLMAQLGAAKRDHAPNVQIRNLRRDYHVACAALRECDPATEPDIEQANAAWWDRWAEYLTGENDDEAPIYWSCDDYQPEQD